MKCAIIFGSSGQDGFYLNQILSKNKIQTYLVSRNNSNIIGDVSDKRFVEKIINDKKPCYIFHFAAISNISHEFLFENHSSISIGTLNILESVQKYSRDSKVFIAGSAEQFQNKGIPINENTPFKANSSYSAERIYSTFISRYYREKFSLKVYNGFLFHHDSPQRKKNHLNTRIIQFFKSYKIGQKKKFVIGDPDIEKEYNFAGDIMQAVWILVNQDKIYEVVIGSGIPCKISEWINLGLEKKGLSWEKSIQIDKHFKSPYRKLYSNPSIIKSLGWQPKYNIKDLFNLMYDNYL